MTTPPSEPDPRLALQPVVTSRYAGGRLIVSWTPVAAAYGYRVVVTGGDGSDYRAEVTESPLTCDFVPRHGVTYTVTVEVLGIPGEAAALTVPDAVAMLRGLGERLVAARTPEGVYTFGEDVVLADAVRELIGAYPLTAAADPVLDDEAVRLSLAGASTGLTVVEGPVELVFTVSDEYELQATWTARPGDGYRLADTFEELAGGPYEYLDLAGPVFVATTYAHTEPGVFFEVQPGVSFQAGVSVPQEMSGASVLVGGALREGPVFAWPGERAFEALTIDPIGRDALTLTGGLVSLTEDRLEISGTVTLDGIELPAVLDFPTAITPAPVLRLIEPPLTGTTSGALLTATGLVDVVGERLPATLLDLAGVRVRELDMAFSPAGTEPTVTTVVLDFGTATWTLVPGLTLSGFRLETTVRAAEGYDPAGSVLVAGSVAVGDGVYEVTAGSVGDGTWYLEIEQEGVAAGDVTGLAGMDVATATGMLPRALLDGFPLTLTRAFVLADPAAAEIAEVEFTIAQTTPWSIAGGTVTVTGWTADISVARDKDGEWHPSAVLYGTVAVGGTGFAVSLAMPPGENGLWMLEMNDDAVVRLPSLGELLDLFGGTATGLPANVADLGDLEITGFKVGFDTGLSRVAFMFVRIAQASDWVIIPGAGADLLALHDFTAALSVTPEGSAGFLEGTLVVGGVPVDTGLVKNGPTEDWVLRAGWNTKVAVPGWNALEGWLSPSLAGATLPVEMPLSDGFDVSRVWLRLSGTSGALTELGFTLYTDKLWKLREGFSLTEVRAQLRMPWPVRADAIDAVLGGVLTLGGVEIAIVAVKPAGGPWEFGGSLLYGLTIDLVEAVNGITGGHALPGDAAAYGLPAEITIESAEVLAVPETGRFHFQGEAGFDWEFQIAGVDVAVRSIGGTIDIPAAGEPAVDGTGEPAPSAGTEAPLFARLTGVVDVASIRATVSAELGTVDTPTVLTGTLEPAELAALDLASVTAMGAADGGWRTVAPELADDLAFSGAAFALNLTERRLLLYGEMAHGDEWTVAGLVHCVPSGDGWSYVVALALPGGFRFGDLFGALSVVDDYLSVGDARLVVCDLPGTTLGDAATRTTGALLAIDPEAESPLDDLDGDPRGLSTGVYVSADLVFAGPLFSKVLQIGRDGTPPVVRLFAVIDQSVPGDGDVQNTTVFGATLPDIVVLDSIAFTGLELTYRPDPADRLEIAGNVALTGVFGDDYSFGVTLVVDSTRLTAAVEQTSREIVNPFLLPGIVLSGLSMDIAYVWAQGSVPASSTFALTGHVLLGRAPAAGETDERVSCLARLALIDGSPALFAVTLDRDLSVGGLLASLVTGHGADWPSDFVDVVFRATSRVCYATADGVSADPTFIAGLMVDATVRLTLLVSLELHVVVTFLRVGDRYVGMRMDVALLEPLDLAFITFSGPEFGGGPVLAVETGDNAKFELSTGISFLHERFVRWDVTVRQGADGGNVFGGHLKTDVELEPFGKLACDFTYTTHPGRDSELELIGWPEFDWVLDLFDIFAAIRSLGSQSSICGALAALVPLIGYDTTFRLTPDVAMEGDKLVFLLTGTYDFTVELADDPFLEVTLPPLRVEIAADTHYDQLPGRLAEELLLAGPRFAADLLRQPEKIAILTGMLITEKAVEAAMQLACEGLVEGAVAAAAEAAAGLVATTVGGAAAVTASAVLSVVTGSLSDSRSHSGGGGGGGGGGSDDDDDGGSSSGGSGGGSSGGGSGTARPDVPVLKSLTYAEGNVTAKWDAAARASAYTFELLGPDDAGLGSADFAARLDGTLPLRAEAFGVYHGRVRSSRGDVLSGWATLPLVRTAPPEAAVTLADTGLVVSWTDATDADRYQVRLGDVVTEVAGTLREVELPVPEPGTVTVEIQAVRAGEIPGGWSAPASLEVLPAPDGVTVRQEESRLVVSWRPLTGRDDEIRYAVEIAGTGEPVVRLGDTAISMSLDGPFTEHVVHRLRVRASADGGLGLWSAPAEFVYIAMPGPEGLRVSQRGDMFHLRWWTPVVLDEPMSYQAQTYVGYGYAWVSVDEDGNIVESGSRSWEEIRSEATGLNTGEADLALGGYGVRVRFTTPVRTGPWAVETPRLLEVPNVQEARYASEAIGVTWWPVEGATYEVSVSPGDLVLTSQEPALEISTDMLAQGTLYELRVRSVAGEDFGTWSDPPVRVVTVDPPAGVTASYADGTLEIGWQQVSGAEHYRVTVLDADGGVLKVAQEDGPVTWDAADLPRGAGFAVRVASMIEDVASADSAPVTFAMFDPPAGLTADHDGVGTRLSWSAVPGADQYRVRLLNSQGTVVKAVVTRQTTAEIAALGVTAQVRVVGQAWSAAVPVARYTCLSFTGDRPTVPRVSQRELDTVYKPTQTPTRTGWVATILGAGGPLSVLTFLTAAVVRSGPITQPQLYPALNGGDLQDLPAVPADDYTTPVGVLEAILRLDRVLAAKGVLTANAPYHAFNGSLTVPFAREGTGPLVAVAFGTATDLPGAALPGARGSVVFGIPEGRATVYTPNPENKNWLVFTDDPGLPLTLLRRLVKLLADREVLTAAEAAAVL
ncbi:hypothetical protein GCM10009677_09390 [Sphaerisporangium rubeum]|uniref:Fibronectin type-III domain-containing protein n=1 Tax=Sphaerisporangium rubeum TaxID=321317 RepID=A0A7X0MAX9_9ACTN|nr:hypothetical protein [Sphaerisporangium rubeum]MBB6476554.1 hypothetical protein [Sphaerisporangium rubeum]